MQEGREVVEDYGHVGLTLRQHPVAFLRSELAARKMVPCNALDGIRDGRYVWLAGLILVRQRPGSAKGRSEEHTSELQSLMRISDAVFCLKKKPGTSQLRAH